MSYNIKYYSIKKAKNREQYFDGKKMFYNKGIDTNKIFFDYLIDYLNKNKNKKINILDLGTGTGYVPKMLCNLIKANFKIIGVDLSENMIKIAKEKCNNKKISFKLANNNKLPFKKNSFQIVTNKLSTQFNIKEINRVLKKDGVFVFKEYNKNKGFKEIKNIFKNRYKKNSLSHEKLINELNKYFKEVIFQQFFIKRQYSLQEINRIFNMADLINNFNNEDLKKIKKILFKNKKKIEITSDPIIIYAKK